MKLSIFGPPRVTLAVFKAACRGGSGEVVSTLLGPDGLDPNKEFKKDTPLLSAVYEGNAEVVKAILDMGAAVDNGRPTMVRNRAMADLIVTPIL